MNAILIVIEVYFLSWLEGGQIGMVERCTVGGLTGRLAQRREVVALTLGFACVAFSVAPVPLSLGR